MPITRKQQLLSKLETTEGGGATFASTDAIQVFDPSLSDNVDLLDRVPAGPTLSRDFQPIGRKTRQVTFRSDFRGSGTGSTAPDFAGLLQASGYKSATPRVLTLAAVTGNGFQLGEQVFQGASYATATAVGVVIGVLSAANAPLHVSATSGQKLVVAVVSGTFASATLTTGNSSASTTTISADAAYSGLVYQPTSEKLISVTTAAWAGGTPSAVGEVLAVESAGLKVGAVQIISETGGTYTAMSVTLLWGSIANGNTLRNAVGTGTGVINAAPTMTRTPSLAMRHNLDGRNRLLLGARGDFSLEGEVGQPMQFNWTFTGDPGVDADAAPITTSGLSTVRAPRLLGAFCCYGVGNAIYRLPTKRVALAQGNTVNPNLDANRAGGSTGSNITDRDPSFTVTVDMVHSNVNWESLRDSGSIVRVGFLLGDTLGNMVSLVAPNCQVTECALGDADGVATFDVTMKPLRIAESGDDELYIGHL